MMGVRVIPTNTVDTPAVVEKLTVEPAQDTAPDKLLASIDKDLNEGKVVVVYKMSNNDTSSEQYADWAAYLNELSSTGNANYKIYPTNEVFNRKLTISNITPDEDYTVFLKRGKPSYYYDGVIVEPMVYTAVYNSYSDVKLTDIDIAFMPDVIDFK